MIAKENRLRKNRQFNFIYRHGEAKHTQYLSICYAKTKIQPFKVGFTVSKKVGKSVVRSKVKRHLTESFNQIKKQVSPAYNYVFIAKEGISEKDFFTIKDIMITLLKKANCYDNN